MAAPAFPGYAAHRSPAEVISHPVRPHFRFPLPLRHVDGRLAARGILVSHDAVRQWGLKGRAGVREPDPPQAAPCRQQTALGRGSSLPVISETLKDPSKATCLP